MPITQHASCLQVNIEQANQRFCQTIKSSQDHHHNFLPTRGIKSHLLGKLIKYNFQIKWESLRQIKHFDCVSLTAQLSSGNCQQSNVRIVIFLPILMILGYRTFKLMFLPSDQKYHIIVTPLRPVVIIWLSCVVKIRF